MKLPNSFYYNLSLEQEITSCFIVLETTKFEKKSV